MTTNDEGWDHVVDGARVLKDGVDAVHFHRHVVYSPVASVMTPPPRSRGRIWTAPSIR